MDLNLNSLDKISWSSLRNLSDRARFTAYKNFSRYMPGALVEHKKQFLVVVGTSEGYAVCHNVDECEVYHVLQSSLSFPPPAGGLIEDLDLQSLMHLFTGVARELYKNYNVFITGAGVTPIYSETQGIVSGFRNGDPLVWFDQSQSVGKFTAQELKFTE